LAIQGSDIDVLVHDETVKFPVLFNSVLSMLLEAYWTVYVERIESVVPILKLKDAETGIHADVCFNREDGYKGLTCAISMQIHFPELRPLYFILKVFLKERDGLD